MPEPISVRTYCTVEKISRATSSEIAIAFYPRLSQRVLSALIENLTRQTRARFDLGSVQAAFQAPGILVRRYDPKMVILDLFVLRVFRLICTHNYRIE
jgi:hypothetical protein